MGIRTLLDRLDASPLTYGEVLRMGNALGMGPLTKRDSDARLVDLGLLTEYDEESWEPTDLAIKWFYRPNGSIALPYTGPNA